jgi:hypothetical protein
MTTKTHEQGARLIRSAFNLARESGSADWQTMTTAVLKNRLLDLTDREFKETDWEAKSFREFVALFSDVIEAVPGAHPSEVRLLGDLHLPPGVASGKPLDLGARRNIRSDLWNAILDYSSGKKYWWDGERAVSDAEDAVSLGKLLPTLDEEEFKTWRHEFVQEQSTEKSEHASFLYGWLERTEPLAQLPASLRIPWVIELKRRVLTRLEEWFEQEGIPLPADVVTDNWPKKRTDTDVLRDRVLAAVSSMSREELESLMLPATVLLRSRN